MRSSRNALRAVFAATLAAWALASQAIPRPDDEQMQSWLHREVDGSVPMMVMPIDPGPPGPRLGHALLDAAWAEPAYRSHLHAWLDANAPGARSADDLVFAWERHYHQALGDSFEFESDPASQMLWMASGNGIASVLPRGLCQTRSADEIARMKSGARARLMTELGDSMVKSLAKALGREFARQDAEHLLHPAGQQSVSKVVMISLHATIATLPADDGKRLYDAFAYKAPPVGPQEQCERDWVRSNAVLKTELDDLPKGISSKLMRQSIAQSAYQQRFMDWDTADIARPEIADFTPGKTLLHKPMILMRNNATGVTLLRLHVDEAGHFTGATLVSSTLAPEPLAAIDGARVPATEPLLPAIDAWLRDGSFKPRLVDGVARPFDVDVSLAWQ